MQKLENNFLKVNFFLGKCANSCGQTEIEVIKLINTAPVFATEPKENDRDKEKTSMTD